MKLPQHVGLSCAVSGTVYALTQSAAMTAASFFAGFLIDLDHWYDYFREHGLRFDVRHFFHTFNKTLIRRLVLPLHSWELLFLLLCVAIITRFDAVVTGILIGFTHHLISDQWFNTIHRFGYFFTYRARVAFASTRITPGKGLSGKSAPVPQPPAG